MPLTGTFERTLDEKLRLALPKPVRDDLIREGESIYVAPEPEGAVGIYSASQFEARAEKISRSSGKPEDVRKFRRIYYSSAETVSADSQGRIRITERLAKRAGLAGEVIVLGVGDHLEVWNKETWQDSADSIEEEFDALANIAFRTP